LSNPNPIKQRNPFQEAAFSLFLLLFMLIQAKGIKLSIAKTRACSSAGVALLSKPKIGLKDSAIIKPTGQ
jgi:hypothetical protein